MALYISEHPMRHAGIQVSSVMDSTKRPLFLPAFLEVLEMFPGVVQRNLVST